MKSRIVIGVSGMVGEHILNALDVRESQVLTTYNKTPVSSAEKLNIADKAEVDEIIQRISPDIIYLPAAITNVDYCENHLEESYNVNVIGVQNIVNASNSAGSRLVYFSTDYIFDGKNGPYDESTAANPISEYGRQKLEAEHYIALFAEDYLIIRTTVVFGWERQGKNFVYRLIKSLSNGVAVNVPVDQIGTPTYVNNLAQIAVQLSETSMQGVINVAGSRLINRYEFAKKAAAVFMLDENLIKSVHTDELYQPARRPLSAGLLTAKLEDASPIPIVDYEEGLRLMAGERPSTLGAI